MRGREGREEELDEGDGRLWEKGMIIGEEKRRERMRGRRERKRMKCKREKGE